MRINRDMKDFSNFAVFVVTTDNPVLWVLSVDYIVCDAGNYSVHCNSPSDIRDPHMLRTAAKCFSQPLHQLKLSDYNQINANYCLSRAGGLHGYAIG